MLEECTLNPEMEEVLKRGDKFTYETSDCFIMDFEKERDTFHFFMKDTPRAAIRTADFPNAPIQTILESDDVTVWCKFKPISYFGKKIRSGNVWNVWLCEKVREETSSES